MFSVDPFSAQRGLCALTKYNGSTDSTNYDNSQHRLGTHSVVCRLVHTLRGVSICAHNPWCVDLCNTIRGVSTCARSPWCVDLCTHSVVCRLVHTLRGVSTCAHNPWCVDLCTQSVVCRLVHTIRAVSTCAHTPWCVDLCTQSVVCRNVHTLRAVSTGKVSRRTGAYFQRRNSAHKDWCLCQCVSPH